MSQRGEPTPAARQNGRAFNPPRVVPLRPPAASAAPAEDDRSATDPAASGAHDFATTSLELASYLLASGHRIVQTPTSAREARG